MPSTETVVVVALVLLIVWEVWTVKNQRDKDTISDVIWRAAAQQPVVIFFAGVLCGHWFWPPARCRELLASLADAAVRWLS